MPDLTPKDPARPLLWPDLTYALQDLLNDYPQPIYIVGGAVRDAYQRRPVHDFDLTTPTKAVKLARYIADAMEGDVFVMDAERDVARVLLKDRVTEAQVVIDVTRFRGDDLLADLQARDFTLNAIAVDLHGDLEKIIDPLGGEQDLNTRRLRRCSPHALSDDPLRALRGIRQSVQLNVRIDPETLTDLRAADLSDISPERVRDELVKMLMLQKPTMALRVAASLGLLMQIIPEIEPLKTTPSETVGMTNQLEQVLFTVEKMCGILDTISNKRTDTTAARFDMGMIVMTLDRYRPQLQAHVNQKWANERPHRVLMLLAALLHLTDAEAAAARASALRLSNDEKAIITAMVRHHAIFTDVPLTDLALHRFWYPLRSRGVDVCLLALATYMGRFGAAINQDAWIDYIDRIARHIDAFYGRYETVVEPDALIDGTLLMESLALKPGKQIGEMLTRIREMQVTGEVETTEQALAAAKALL